MSHFQNLKPITYGQSITVEGINDVMKATWIGDFVFNIQDDNGSIHTIILSDSLYIPDIHMPLLCPQHWARVASDHLPNPHGTGANSRDCHTILYWDQHRYSKTVVHNSHTNTPIFGTAAITHKDHASDATSENMLHKTYPPLMCLSQLLQRNSLLRDSVTISIT